MKSVCKGFCKGNSLFLSGFRYFISSGIHNHRRVVIVLIHHILQVFSVVIQDLICVVIFGFVDVPAVNILVHYQHSHLITGTKKRLGTWVVGRTDRIVSSVQKNAYFTAFRKFIGTCAKKSVVVMDASAFKKNTFSIDLESILRGTAYHTDTESFLLYIFAKGYAAGIQIWFFRTPELCSWKCDLAGKFAVCLKDFHGNNILSSIAC